MLYVPDFYLKTNIEWCAAPIEANTTGCRLNTSGKASYYILMYAWNLNNVLATISYTECPFKGQNIGFAMRTAQINQCGLIPSQVLTFMQTERNHYQLLKPACNLFDQLKISGLGIENYFM